MPKQNKKKRLWIQNLLNRYRVVVISESTFEERFLTRISQLRIILLLTFFVLFIVIGSALMVAYTPLKEFIPGYTTTALRKEAIRNSFLLDLPFMMSVPTVMVFVHVSSTFDQNMLQIWYWYFLLM